MNYVTYDSTGALTGAYSQDLRPEHALYYIEVDQAIILDWPSYRANEARDGVVLAMEVPATIPDIDALAAQYEIAVQRHLDTTAQAFGYDNMATAVTYADEPAVARFQAEGSALRAWRSLVWEACYMMLAEVRAGTRAVPTEAEVIAALPEAPAQEALA